MNGLNEEMRGCFDATGSPVVLTGSSAFGVEIQALQKLLTEKDAEIERIKDEFQKAKEWNRFSEIQIKNLQNIVEAQNALLVRAADALEQHQMVTGELIDELRKAAEVEN